MLSQPATHTISATESQVLCCLFTVEPPELHRHELRKTAGPAEGHISEAKLAVCAFCGSWAVVPVAPQEQDRARRPTEDRMMLEPCKVLQRNAVQQARIIWEECI